MTTISKSIAFHIAAAILVFGASSSYVGAAGASLEFGNQNIYGSWYYEPKSIPSLEIPGEEPVSTQYGLALNQRLDNSTIRTFVSWDEYQKFNQVGIDFSGIAVDGFIGEGETVSTVANPFGRIDPFLFHGGVVGNYDFSGYSFSSKLGTKTKIMFSAAQVQGNNLDRRSARAFGYSRNTRLGRIGFSYTEVLRDRQHVGSVFGFEFDRGKHKFGFDYLSQDNGASFQSVRYGWGKNRKHYSLEFQRARNPLFTEKDDNRILFNMGLRFGSKHEKFFATEDTEEGEQNSGKTNVLIAGGVVGAALLLSSGSSSSDEQPRFASQNASARSVLNGINPVSIAENREYGGYVYRNADGSFSNTVPIPGEAASLLLPPVSVVVPGTAVPRATYHTHAAFDPRFDNENFSPTDIATNISLGLDGYLGTPGGAFKYHQLSTGLIFTLGTIATE